MSCTSSDLLLNLYPIIRQWIDEGTLPPLGASPDGLIRHSDGTVEVIEVKCSSPFLHSSARGTAAAAMMEVSLKAPMHQIGAWHLPQLQMEMFCAGPACSSAIVVMLSVEGAVLYRLRRNEEVRFRHSSYSLCSLSLYICRIDYPLPY